MTTGALIFAHNNDHIDYVAMAHWSAQNIQRHLGIPTHIVTDAVTDDSNTRWFGDYGTSMSWHNQSRVTAYDASPWDRTLVLDADYVVASDQLQTIMDADRDFLCFRRAYDVTGVNDFSGHDTFGDTRMPMWWATVMWFNRSRRSQQIFEAMAMIRNNWTHYRRIYKINQATYRNDYALSIALCLLQGHMLNVPAIPWSMASVMPEHKLTQTDADRYRVEFKDPKQRSRWIELHAQDFHAMGKQQLGDIVADPC
jgi:hypothetical protein